MRTGNNRAFKGTYNKGFGAAKRGVPRASNPYLDKKQKSGSSTFTQAFQQHWEKGWSAASKDAKPTPKEKGKEGAK